MQLTHKKNKNCTILASWLKISVVTKRKLSSVYMQREHKEGESDLVIHSNARVEYQTMRAR